MSNNLDFSIQLEVSSPATVIDCPEAIIENSYSISICLKCFNKECEPVIQALREEYESQFDEDEIEKYLCLINIKLNIFPNFQHLEYTDYDGIENENQFGVKYRVYLQDFYNNVTKYGKGISFLNPKLKGAGFSLLCMVLKKALETNLISLDDNIVLIASGDLDDREDMSGLIRYYEKLGFQQSYPENEKENIDDFEVPMHGSVRNIVNNCKKNKISNELKHILESI
jgi:hypothetical protein